MPRFDLSPTELETYLPDVGEPADFEEFWASTLAESRAVGGEVVVTAEASPFRTLDVFDVTFPGFAGDPVKAWLTLPRGIDGPLPAVVEYNGYGGGRGLPVERLGWASAGYAHLFMDTRGQGSGWGSGGGTPDPHGTGPSSSGFMTRGIERPEDYYYRRVFTTPAPSTPCARCRTSTRRASRSRAAARAAGSPSPGGRRRADRRHARRPVPLPLRTLRRLHRPRPLSGGGPLSLGLSRRRTRVFETLSYFDGVNFAKRATPRPVLGRAARPDLPAVDRLRRLQPLRRRRQAHRGLRPQRARRRRRLSVARPGRLPEPEPQCRARGAERAASR